MKKLLYLFLLLPLVLVTSCKKSSGGGGDDGDSLTSIDVSVIHDPVIYGLEQFAFRTTGNDGISYTLQSTYFVNGSEITGNTYRASAPGTYQVHSVKDGLTSSTITITASDLNLTVAATPNPTYIEMDPFEFTATGDNGTDYTNTAEFFVNGTAITGHSYDPDTADDYEIYAKLADGLIVSPTITVVATVGYTSLTVATNPNVLVGQAIDFTATDNLGRDLSDDATFYVNGGAITGKSYSPTAGGNYEVYAIYDGIQSATENFTAITPTHTTKVLVEDYTGGWCGYCPRLWWKLDDAVEQNENIIPAAIHNGDEMAFENEGAMSSEFGITGFPSGRYNRVNDWNETESQLNDAQAEVVGLGLAINSTKTGNNLSITVKVGFDLTYTDEVKLVLYLLEDGLHYDQANYYDSDTTTPVFGLGNPIENFEFNYVVRKAYTDVFGDVIPGAEAVTGGVYTRTFDVAIPLHTAGDGNTSNVENPDNIHLIAFVVDAETKEVINAQKADIGVNQDFD